MIYNCADVSDKKHDYACDIALQQFNKQKVHF